MLKLAQNMSRYNIVILPKSDSTPQEKGDFFEKIISKVFNKQRFQVKERINFTGSEIDLVLDHRDRKDSAYVECKAKERLTSEEISKFVFNVNHRKKDYGFFIYTKDFEHQVGGVIEELKDDHDKRYDNLYFWNADKVVELLVDSGDLVDFSLPSTQKHYKSDKIILLYSHFGKYYIPLLFKNTLPEAFAVFDATTLDSIGDQKIIKAIKSIIPEVKDLVFFDYKEKKEAEDSSEKSLDIIAEIQVSESWDDLVPASSRFFVGRKNIVNDIVGFFIKILEKETNKRIFYLDGNSGWGKSSIVNQLRSKSRNKYYKNRLFVYALDSRSANTSNYVALAFTDLIQKAIKAKFIPPAFSNLRVNSNLDILGSSDTSKLFEYLEANNRELIIVFDQFEDVFRKEDLFRVFHKFMLDVNSARTNLSVGFSWKSEINIPINHEAYYLWQQMSEYANKYSVAEFSTGECLLIVKQLKKAIGKKLTSEFSSKIAQTSQGFPWLVKKLCVHLFRELGRGISEEKLFEADFNTQVLFDKDLSELTKDEIKALKYIAKRAHENNAFDIVDIDEGVADSLLKALINKRLVIKSGSKFNVYWDIFRDYLVTGEIPQVGDTYFVKAQSVETLLSIFLLFRDESYLTTEKLSQLIEKTGERKNSHGTIQNLLTDLRKIGLITLERGKYKLRSNVKATEKFFKDNLQQKLLRHTIYIEITKLNKTEIELENIVQIISKKFKGTDSLSEKTLILYAKVFLAWLVYSGLPMPRLSKTLRSYTRNVLSFTPQNKPKIVVEYLLGITKNKFSENEEKGKILYDLKYLGFLDYRKVKSTYNCELTSEGKKLLTRVNEKEGLIAKTIFNSETTEKIKLAYEKLQLNHAITHAEFKKTIADALVSINSKVYKNKTSIVLYEWAVFLHKYL